MDGPTWLSTAMLAGEFVKTLLEAALSIEAEVIALSGEYPAGADGAI